MGNTTHQDKKNWGVNERLKFIERTVYWRGWIRRADVSDRFDITFPQVSADIAEYQRINPGALAYDGAGKRYVASAKMKPTLAEQDFADGLALLGSSGESADIDRTATIDLPRHFVPQGPAKALIRAVFANEPIKIHYYSVNSQRARLRPILPRAFGHDGYRWHVRAYCYERCAYQDFVLGRISQTRPDNKQRPPVPPDHDWNTWETIEFRPHRSLSEVQRKAVARDFGMTRGIGRLRVRKAMSLYTRVYLGLDSEPSELHRRLERVGPKASTKATT